VVLDRPDKRNAQRPEMWRALAEFGETLPDSVRVVVVTGNGPSFSAGLDRSMFGQLGAEVDAGDDSFLDTIASYQAGFSWLRRPEFISVAAVQGHAIGRPLQMEEISPGEARQELTSIMPIFIVNMLLNAWSAGVGQPAFVTSTVAEVTGFPARTFADWAADHVAEFVG